MNDIRELNISELSIVSGASIAGAMAGAQAVGEVLGIMATVDDAVFAMKLNTPLPAPGSLPGCGTSPKNGQHG